MISYIIVGLRCWILSWLCRLIPFWCFGVLL